jgi:CBS domain-containing protein
MKVREAMTADPVCCLATDTAQKIATILRDHNIGSVPVVRDLESRKLIGVITDRDLCCSILGDGLDPKHTVIDKFMTRNPVTCRDGENLEKCERSMQEHQIRRIPIVDGEGRCVGILSQADLALKDKPERVSRTVAEISKPEQQAQLIAA